jgi:HPt (histidine-containing phosphotransfer) domain-containing protein
MSDYLTKPITALSLLEMLARHLQRADPGPAAMAAPSLPAKAAAQRLQLVFEASVLAELPMVADGTEPDFALSVLEQFVQDSVQMVENCRLAAAVDDNDGALREVHTLKSTSAQIGALALAAWAGEMEEHLRAGHRLDGDSCSRLLNEHRQALLAITSYLARARTRAVRALPEDRPA